LDGIKLSLYPPHAQSTSGVHSLRIILLTDIRETSSITDFGPVLGLLLPTEPL